MPTTSGETSSSDLTGLDFRLGWVTLSNPNESSGRTSRASAVYNALLRRGTPAALAAARGMWMIGAPDAPRRWAGGLDRIKWLSNPVPSDLGDEEAVRGTEADLYRLTTNLNPDLVLLDNYFSWSKGIMADESLRQTTRLWGISRYYEGHYRGIPTGGLDRMYQTEPFQTGIIQYNRGMCREQRSSPHERSYRDNGTPIPDNGSVKEDGSWDHGHHRADRKLIAPIVDVDPAQMKSREDARLVLLAAAGVVPSAGMDTNRWKIVVCMGSPGRQLTDGVSSVGSFRDWCDRTISGMGLDEEINRGQAVVVRVGLGQPALPDLLYKYLAGADVVLSGAGYNTFYEVRLCRQLGFFNGLAYYWPMTDRSDQAWRAYHQETLADTSDRSNPFNVGNGADYLAEQIERLVLAKAGGAWPRVANDDGGTTV